jgi:GNAT superfamily N-acetyltransferase
MIFRIAEIEDILAMSVVRLAVKENVLSNPELVTDADYLDFITRRGRGWVCEMDREIVGFSIVDLVENNVWALFVHPSFEARGIGKRLHILMLDWYFSQKTEKIWLGTAPKSRAADFYRKNKWQEIGILKNGELRFEMVAADWNA